MKFIPYHFPLFSLHFIAKTYYYMHALYIPHFRILARYTVCPLTNKRLCPSCSLYFFTKLDPVGQACVYDGGALGVGLFIIVLIVLLEGMSFFVTQFSALEILHARERHSLAISKVDAVTRFIGKQLTILVDFFVVATHRFTGGGRVGQGPRQE